MKIDWENITLQEAQQIADELCSAFSVTVKCFGSENLNDVSYLNVVGEYDDNLHAKDK